MINALSSMQSFLLPPNGEYTPEEMERRKMLAQALLQQSQGTEPIGSPWQGAAKLAQALMGGLALRKANGMEAANRKAGDSLFSQALGAMTSPGYSPDLPPVSPLASPNVPPSSPGPMGTLAARPKPIPPMPDVINGGSGDSVMAGGASGDKLQWLRYSNQHATRNQPLSGDLVKAMDFLPNMGVTMEVFSGGQDASGRRRTGSHRHDHGKAADVFFYKDGRKLDWANPQDAPIFAEIVRQAKSRGLTGFGAGEGYMMPGSVHIGYGAPAAWGKGGKGRNAAKWLVAALNGGPMPAPEAAPAVAPSRSNAPNDRLAGLPPEMMLMNQQQLAGPQIVPTAGPAPAAMPQATARPMSAYDRMIQTALAKGSLQDARPGQNPASTGAFPARAPMAAPPPVPPPQAPGMAPQASNSGQGGAMPSAARILQFMQNPDFFKMRPEQRQIVMDLYQRAVEAEKPMSEADRLDLELKRATLDEKRAPKPGYRQLTPQEAQQRGLDPKKIWQLGPNNQLEAVGGGGVNVDARQMGTIPPGYRAIYDANGNIVELQPIKGGPAAADAQAADAAAAARKASEQERGNIVTQDIDRVLRVMESGILPDTGWGAYLSNVPGTDAKAVASLLDTIKANIGFDELNKMRQQSPTGGALGQVTEKELAFLQAVAGSLDQSQDAAQLTDNLNRLWNAYMDTIHGKGNGPARRTLSFDTSANGEDPLGIRQ